MFIEKTRSQKPPGDETDLHVYSVVEKVPGRSYYY